MTAASHGKLIDSAASQPKNASGRCLKDFGKLSSAEAKLVDSCRRGRMAVIAEKLPEAAGPDNRVRATFVRFLALGGDAEAVVQEPGVQLRGAWLVGTLDLSMARIERPLVLDRCRILLIKAHECRIRSIDLSRSNLKGGLQADGLRCEDNLIFARLRASQLNLIGAVIGGELNCQRSRFENVGKVALNLSGATIGSDTYLNWGFRALGEVRFRGAKINGQLDCVTAHFDNKGAVALNFDGARITGNLLMDRVRSRGTVTLIGVEIGGDFSCLGGRFENRSGTALRFDLAQISGLVALSDGFHAIGEVNFARATIGDYLTCSNAKLRANKGGRSLHFDQAKISSNVFLGENFRCSGSVRLMGASVGGNLECRGRFENATGTALILDHVEVSGSVHLADDFTVLGAVSLYGATIGRDLQCDGGRFEFPGKIVLDCELATIAGRASFAIGFSSTGTVSLDGAKVGGNLRCSGGTFDDKSGTALSAREATISLSVLLNDTFRAAGAVTFEGARIGRDFDCEKAQFDNQDPEIFSWFFPDRRFSVWAALSLDRASISGDVILTGIEALGAVTVIGAIVGGNFDCESATIKNEDDRALILDRAAIAGNVSLRSTRVFGDASLTGATIGGNFDCNRASFSSPREDALRCELTRVGRAFIFTNIEAIDGPIDLSTMQVGVLRDDPPSWERADGKLVLDGFSYDRLADPGPTDATSRIAWLDRQVMSHLTTEFRPQPWEQLIAVLRAMGHPNEARKVGIAREDRIRRAGKIVRGARFLHMVYGTFVGYGYRPARLLTAVMAVWLMCGVVYWIAAHPARGNPPLIESVAVPKESFSSFSPFVYSADVLLPIVDLGYSDKWHPVLNTENDSQLIWGHAVRYLRWLEIILGWLFGGALAAMLGTLIKKE